MSEQAVIESSKIFFKSSKEAIFAAYQDFPKQLESKTGNLFLSKEEKNWVKTIVELRPFEHL